MAVVAAMPGPGAPTIPMIRTAPVMRVRVMPRGHGPRRRRLPVIRRQVQPGFSLMFLVTVLVTRLRVLHGPLRSMAVA